MRPSWRTAGLELTSGTRRSRLRRRPFDESQAMLELGEAKLELVVLAPSDEPELLEEAAHGHARPLAHAHGVAAPAAKELVAELARLVPGDLPALGQLVGELVRPVLRQIDRAEGGEERALDGLPCAAPLARATGIVHAASPVGACAAPRAAPQ